MEKVSGFVSYGVMVSCPHCNKSLGLSEYPYKNDELGLAIFGGKNQPAKWRNLEIEYKCCACKKKFMLNSIEI